MLVRYVTPTQFSGFPDFQYMADQDISGFGVPSDQSPPGPFAAPSHMSLYPSLNLFGDLSDGDVEYE